MCTPVPTVVQQRLCLILILLAITSMVQAKPDTLIRDEIPDQYKWDLSDIYADWDAWEQDLERVQIIMDEALTLQGTLNEGAHRILEVHLKSDEIDRIITLLYRYASLKSATNSADNDIAARSQQLNIVYGRFRTSVAWVEPELLAIPWTTMSRWLETTPELAPYAFNLSNSYRQQAHVLSADQEKLLSYFNQTLRSPAEVYNQMANADIKYPDVTLSNGDTVSLTPGNYYELLEKNQNQDDRRMASEAYNNVFTAQGNTYASVYNGVLQGLWAMAQARNYDSTLQASLDNHNIPTDVYENLVKMVRENPDPIHRYNVLRKKALNLESYHGYDGSLPLVDFEKTYPWRNVRENLIASVAPLGPAYVAKMETAMAGGWVDVYENQGKRSGAFSSSVYGVHPYVLLNYNETLSSVFIAAHELGHALHSMLAHENQPISTASYTIFVAEIASTLNERLLLDHLLAHTDDPLERVALLTHTIENIIRIFYSAVRYADFELQAHQLVQDGVPITQDVLSEINAKLFRDQNGPAVTFDAYTAGSWPRILHYFEVPFYLYQYATCYAASAQIYQDMTTGPPAERAEATTRYLDLLKSGGNDYPMQQLKKAGVDLTTTDTFQAVIDNLDGLVTQLEDVLQEMEH